MFILAIYLIAALTWGWILLSLVGATINNLKNKIETPKLLVPLVAASLGLFIESLYFFIANIIRYVMVNDVGYMLFLEQRYLFVIKLFMAISGLLMLIKIKSEKDDNDGRK